MKQFIKYKLMIFLLLLFRLGYGQLPDIVAMEYYFDTDPGYGNAISVPITADSIIDINFDADLSLVSSGFHILYVRIKDELGIWSIVLTQGFLIDPEPIAVSTPGVLPQITQMEYFFDIDPGYGNGINVPVTSDSLIDVAFDADCSAINSGFHILYVRTKDELGNWSISFSKGFLKLPEPIFMASASELPQVTQLEYFIDTDPGFGNGTEILNTPDSLIVEDFFADVATLDPGTHLLYTRVKDENDIWSLTQVQEFILSGLLVFLEGPYDAVTGLMSTSLNDQGLIPLEQPFDTNLAAVWYFDGTETVSSIPNANIVDWLLIQARDATNAENATTGTIKENQVAFLLNDGNVVGLDGETPVSLTQPIVNDLFLVVFQRNHLGVMSSVPVGLSSESIFSYNFSNDLIQVYGTENGHKEISPDVWGMMSGDGDGNGQITIDDKTFVWENESGNAGYFRGDFNMNGQVDNIDKNEQWKTNNGKVGEIPD